MATPADMAEQKSEMQNAVLVAASLIATVTYQAGLSPPPTIWKAGMKLHTRCIFQTFTLSRHESLRSSLMISPDVCPASTFFSFMILNTVGFYTSLLLMGLTFYQVRVRRPTAASDPPPISRNRSQRSFDWASWYPSATKILMSTSLISLFLSYISLALALSPNALTFLIIYSPAPLVLDLLRDKGGLLGMVQGHLLELLHVNGAADLESQKIVEVLGGKQSVAGIDTIFQEPRTDMGNPNSDPRPLQQPDQYIHRK
ncbi:hypothetical protein L1049_018096 [Liquidambar formosana]|uniref:PGG domain-containing protein n=1 Tax=Liquidambar formosana TaxID=63359 RepID=A0AAP0NNG4_LIQFO